MAAWMERLLVVWMVDVLVVQWVWKMAALKAEKTVAWKAASLDAKWVDMMDVSRAAWMVVSMDAGLVA